MSVAAWVALFVAVRVILAAGAAFVARSKGRSFWSFLALGLLASGFISLVVALLVKDRRKVDDRLDPFDRLKQLEVLRDAGTMGKDGVAIRAFRGNRRAAVYQEHVVPERAFARMLAAGPRHRLPLLSSLQQHATNELDQDQAHQLSNEIEAVRGAPDLLDLDQHLARIADLARWCARSREQSWLTIVGR